MRVKTSMNHAALHKLSREAKVALSQTASQLLTDLRDQNMMPFDSGNLQNESSFVDERRISKGEVAIIHDTPYAKRLYFNPQYNFNTSKNPKAQGLWWDDWIDGVKRKEPQAIYKKLYARQIARYIG